MQKLAVTVALEHFTAAFSHACLEMGAMQDADPAVAALWESHSVEELEHKSTCFDVYARLGGRHRTRVRALQRAWLLIIALTFWNTFDMLRDCGRLLDIADHAKGAWFLFGPRGLFMRMARDLLAYLRSDFHPWDVDDTSFIVAFDRLHTA